MSRSTVRKKITPMLIANYKIGVQCFFTLYRVSRLQSRMYSFEVMRCFRNAVFFGLHREIFRKARYDTREQACSIVAEHERIKREFDTWRRYAVEILKSHRILSGESAGNANSIVALAKEAPDRQTSRGV